jgi:hypothetical protein
MAGKANHASAAGRGLENSPQTPADLATSEDDQEIADCGLLIHHPWNTL